MKSVELQQKAYRQSGELEAFGAEKLPPTPITPDAFKKLQRFGLSEDQIQHIQDFCSGFHYDHCVDRVKRIAAQDVFLIADDENEYVDIPYFFDMKGKMDGQCVDIARQFVIQAEISGLIEDLNNEAHLATGYKIVSVYCTGTSRTHFNNAGDSHIWNGLSLINDLGVVVDSVLVDAAFQVIATESEAGYSKRSSIYEPKLISSELNERIKIGWIEHDVAENGWNGKIPDTAVLGISEDRKYSFSLGFVRNLEKVRGIIGLLHRNAKKHAPPLPLILRGRADGTRELFFLDPNSQMLISYNAKEEPTPSEKKEILQLLDVARFRFNDNWNEYPRKVNNRLEIRWNDTASIE